MLYQVYDWVTWKVIINRTTWLNTNDIITWHHCLGKEPVLLQHSPANQTPLYSITVNSAISAENVGDSAISTASSLVPPLPAQPLGGSTAILARLLLHTLPEQAPLLTPIQALRHGNDLHTSAYYLFCWTEGPQEALQELSSATSLFLEPSGGAVWGGRPGWAYCTTQIEKESDVLLTLPALANKARGWSRS